MRGSIAECVQHLLEHVSDDNASVLMDFVRISSLKTVRDWRAGKQLPTGERALRLRVFLEAVGYELEEMQPNRVPAPALRVTRLIGYGALEVNYVQSALNYSEPSGLFRILSGGTPTGTRGYRLEMIARGSDEQLNNAKEGWEERLAPLRQLVGLASVSPAAPVIQGAANRPVRVESPPQSRVMPEPEVKEEGAHTSSEGDDDGAIKVLMHLVFALDAFLRDTPDLQRAANRIRQQVSRKRLRVLRGFINQTLQDR